jgi:hypothetical protein
MTRSAFKTSTSHGCHVPRDRRALSLACFEKKLEYPERLGTPVTCVDQGLRLSGHVSLGSTPFDHGTKTWSHSGKPFTQQNERGLELDYQRLRMLYELGA